MKYPSPSHLSLPLREWLLRFFPAAPSNRNISLKTRPFVILFQDSSTLRTNISKLKYYSSLCAEGNLSIGTREKKWQRLTRAVQKYWSRESIRANKWSRMTKSKLSLRPIIFSSKGCERAPSVWKIVSFFHLSQCAADWVAGGIYLKKQCTSRRVYFYFYRGEEHVDKETPFIYYSLLFY